MAASTLSCVSSGFSGFGFRRAESRPSSLQLTLGLERCTAAASASMKLPSTEFRLGSVSFGLLQSETNSRAAAALRIALTNPQSSESGRLGWVDHCSTKWSSGSAARPSSSTKIPNSECSRLGRGSFRPLKQEANSGSAGALRIASANLQRSDFRRLGWVLLELRTNARSAARRIGSSSSRTRKRLAIAAAAAAEEVVKEVQSPPIDYDFRAEVMEDTLRVVGSTYPELTDLVEDGVLVVVLRPADYVERRSDGYKEPDMVFVVGTAHMSLLSASQVGRVIRAVRPENVVVELCRSRAGIMYPPGEEDQEDATGSQAAAILKEKNKRGNLMGITGDNFGAAMGRSLRLGGRSALALRLLLGGLSEKLSKATGVTSGEEFRAARKAAEEVGSQLVLGDRPIEVTLKRAWEALKWEERFRLATIVFQAMNSSLLDDVSEELLQTLKSDDALSQMFAEMGSRLPSLLQPLVYERDMYLAWSLKRSKAVNGCARVVGVLGKGHLRGVVYNLKHNQENLRFRDLVGPRSPPGTPGKPTRRSQPLQDLVKMLFEQDGPEKS